MVRFFAKVVYFKSESLILGKFQDTHIQIYLYTYMYIYINSFFLLFHFSNSCTFLVATPPPQKNVTVVHNNYFSFYDQELLC